MSRPSPQTDRLLDLVDLLSRQPTDGVTLAEVARALGLSKATIHPMMVTLTRRGWLLRHPERHTYRLGPALVAAGRVAAHGHPVVDAARPVVRDLAAATGLTCLAFVAGAMPGEPDELLVGEIGQPPQPPVGGGGDAHRYLRLGDRFPRKPPIGSTCVAWSDDPGDVERWLDQLGPERPADALAQITPSLDGVRARGWSAEVDSQLRERIDLLASELGEDQRGVEHAAALRRILGDVHRLFGLADALPAVIEPAGSYRVSTVCAPVFDGGGDVVVVLAAICASEQHHAPPRTGAEVLLLGERVAAAAGGLTAATQGRPPRTWRRRPPAFA
ncbi:helix-turn-helix domain-containing protein [Frankia sp. AgB1.9]|uniref:helix-turn-helix domain-containing protein n=1 Tax=unclassified Frankia TaxID=2632575 RepID=UPI0019334972|nr:MULTISPECIES: helix-turn-helix domain-containing protein [unclassified Frankia]MBL7548777.1 helix-turn-helix domain-containing protein [Frankia sp. AgB1.9]MBL7623890.1 helix-turn-helix domain-containing protein [Frankia sp. AgB1.8]